MKPGTQNTYRANSPLVGQGAWNVRPDRQLRDKDGCDRCGTAGILIPHQDRKVCVWCKSILLNQAKSTK